MCSFFDERDREIEDPTQAGSHIHNIEKKRSEWNMKEESKISGEKQITEITAAFFAACVCVCVDSRHVWMRSSVFCLRLAVPRGTASGHG